MECNHLRANDTAGSESQQRQELIFLEELAKLASDKMKKIGKGESMTSSAESAGVKVNRKKQQHRSFKSCVKIFLRSNSSAEIFFHQLYREGQNGLKMKKGGPLYITPCTD